MWRSYVELMTGDRTQAEVAEATGVDQTTVSRWRRGEGKGAPDPASVAAFCRGFDRNPLEGFVAAGLLEVGDVGDQALSLASRELLATLTSLTELPPGTGKTDAVYEAARLELLGRQTMPSKRRRRRDYAEGPDSETGRLAGGQST